MKLHWLISGVLKFWILLFLERFKYEWLFFLHYSEICLSYSSTPAPQNLSPFKNLVSSKQPDIHFSLLLAKIHSKIYYRTLLTPITFSKSKTINQFWVVNDLLVMKLLKRVRIFYSPMCLSEFVSHQHLFCVSVSLKLLTTPLES